MSSSRRGAGFWISTWWPVAAGMAIIAIESTEWLGSDHTSGPLRLVYQFLFGQVGDDRWEHIHHFIRKAGHFTGYGLIGAAWLRAWWRTLPRSRFLLDTLLAIFGTALISGSDELHQTYLPNRTGTGWDVLLDCCGAFVAQFLIYSFLRVFRPKKLAHEA